MQPDQTILVADKNGRHTGEYVKKEVAHTGRGKRHLAISVLLYNNKKQVLLQKRKHKIHNDIWDLTGSTHHLHRRDGTNETTEEATYRCLEQEYGIFAKIPLKVLGGINYFAADGKFCENEHDIIVAGEYSGEIKPNRDVHYDYQWVEFEDFLKDIVTNPKKYAPWALLAAKKLKDFQIEGELDDMLKKFLEIFENYSSFYFDNKIKNSSKYPKLITKLYKDLADFTNGGKRMRAFLVYLGYVIGGGRDLTKILPISLALEIIHSFLLIHDDIIDKSDTRRKKATIHKRYEKLFGQHYGISQAIVLGDIACFEAFELVNSSKFNADLKQICQKKLYEVLLETAYGEALDIEYSFRKLKISDIMQIADLKTARYSFVGPLTIGAILSKSTTGQIKAIQQFGLLIGIAFQLQDDYLGVFGDEAILGKSVLSDMREGKNTLLIYKAKELGTQDDHKTIDKLWGKNNATLSDLEKIKKIIVKSGAAKWSRAEMRKLVARAQKHVKLMTSDIKLQKVICEMADFIVTRRK